MPIRIPWRFIPAGYVFPNPANPFAEVFLESTAVNVQAGQPQILDFIGLKVGDVNSNAIPSAVPQTQQRFKTSADFLMDCI
ncbi:MAG: hypothetical protein R3E60_00690 [Alphaproteobacteria bacterium]